MLIICVIICVIFLLLAKSENSFDSKMVLFSHIIGLSAVLNTLDLFCFVFYNSRFSILNLLFNSGYFIVGLSLTFLWYLFSVRMIKVPFLQQKWTLAIMSVPYVVIMGLIFASYWNGWFFSLDENGYYCRGPYFAIQMLGCGFYIFVPFCISFARLFMKRYYADSGLNLSLASFGVFPLITMLVQMFLPTTPSISIGVTLSVLLVLINIQTQLISTDPLTGLNNRNRMNRYLDKKTLTTRSQKQLFLFLLDVDKFKDINENFGRLQGDIVLQVVGETLKCVCGHLGHFVARCDDDEFAVVAEMNDFADALYLRRYIIMILSKKSEHLKFPLRISVGYTAWNTRNDSIPDFITRAEKELLADKQSKYI